jgi:hypothetical protein
MEEAFMRSTAPRGEGGETPVRIVQYVHVHNAAAERARELDRLEREEQELRRQQTRSSMQRIPGMGGGSGAGSVGVTNATKPLLSNAIFSLISTTFLMEKLRVTLIVSGD